MFNTPILFLIFNRPAETVLSFDVIKQMKPKYLFVAADGPRADKSGEVEQCQQARNTVLYNIDWNCEIKTLFRTENLGCGKAVQEALDWFFAEVEMGIIIEDDIIPDQSFFEYAEILLIKYKDNYNIFSINGHSLAFENHKYDFGLTRYFNMWGWATWRRSNDLVNTTWSTYDGINDFKKGSKLSKTLKLPTIVPHKEWFFAWKKNFFQTKNGEKNTWDYQWVYTCLKNQQYCIRPNLNLISNIGFNENSTHTAQAPHFMLSELKSNNLKIKNASLTGIMEIDRKYEIMNVAGYWNGLFFDKKSFIKKNIKHLKKISIRLINKVIFLSIIIFTSKK